MNFALIFNDIYPNNSYISSYQSRYADKEDIYSGVQINSDSDEII